VRGLFKGCRIYKTCPAWHKGKKQEYGERKSSRLLLVIIIKNIKYEIRNTKNKQEVTQCSLCAAKFEIWLDNTGLMTKGKKE